MTKFAAGPRTVKLSTVGASVEGIVDAVEEEYQMNFTEDNRPDGIRYDGNGNPVKTTVIYLIQQDDDGNPTQRVKLRLGDSIFTDKGREASRTTSGLAAAIADAVATSKVDDLEVGHTLKVTYTGNAPAESEDRSPAKLYAVEIAA